jgi:hypothetical protein
LRSTRDERYDETNHEHRRLGERGDHHLSAGANTTEACPDVHAAKGEKKPCIAQQGNNSDEIRGPTEQQSRGKSRHKRRGDPGCSENQVRNGPKQPRRIHRQDRFLANKTQKIAIRLEKPAVPGGGEDAPSPCARNPVRTGAKSNTRTICSLARRCRRPSSYRYREQENNEEKKYEAEIASNGEELQGIQADPMRKRRRRK